MLMLGTLLTTERNIARRRQRFEASDSSTSIADRSQCLAKMISATAKSCAGWLSLRCLHLRLQLSQMGGQLRVKEQFTFLLAHCQIALLGWFDWKHCLGEIRRLILLSKDICALRRLLNIENTARSCRLSLKDRLTNFSPPLMLCVRKYAAPAY